MKKMMADMTIKPTTDADRDFVAMMVPHPRVGARSQRDVRAVKHKHSAYDGTRHGRSEPLKHVGGKSLSVRLAIRAGPNAIHLISLDAVDGHQRPSRTQPNQVAPPERIRGLDLRRDVRLNRVGKRWDREKRTSRYPEQ